MVRRILAELLEIGQGIMEDKTYFNIMGTRRMGSYADIFGAEERRYNRAVTYLKKRKELETVEKNSKLFLKLTKKGKVRALLHRLYRDYQKKRVWDGKWRLVIWDIPESSAEQRNRFRYLVKDLGFYQLQKSVFITPDPLPMSAVDYLRESELLRYIRFLKVEKIENDRFLKRYFGIK